ncbi:MAG: nucleotidyltransferase family protein [Eubacteriales bacterium]|nr:nucleotidyltransferase family protein [Eubacteriales bacterium]
MTAAEEKFLELLKNFIWDGQSDMDGFSDWQELLELASIHHVYPMIYEQVYRSEQFAALPVQTRQAARKKMISTVTVQTMRTDAFLKQYERLVKAGVKPLVIKGLICRELYSRPDYRMSSDEDLLVQREEFAGCDRILLADGFCSDWKAPQAGAQQDLPQEVSYLNRETGVYLEVHTALFSKDENRRGRYADLNEAFQDVFARAQAIEIQGVTVYTMDNTDHFLYLLVHALKHFLHAGVGIRQLCDMLLMARQMEKSIDWDDLKARMKKLGIFQFFMSLIEIGEKYLGFSCDSIRRISAGEDCMPCEEMLEDILQGGIYGSSTMARTHSANMTLAAAEHRNGIRASLFPGKEYMRQQFPWLDRFPWLLPFAWGKRALRYGSKINVEKQRGADRETNSIRMGKQRVKMMKKYGIVD